VHDLEVGQVRVGEHDLVDVVVPHHVRQPLLADDGDAVRVARPGEARGVRPVGDPGDLRGREHHDRRVGVVAVRDVEVVEVAAAGSHDHHGAVGAIPFLPRFGGSTVVAA